MSDKQEKDSGFMKAAIAMASKGMNSNAGGPFGAVVVRNGEIISAGHNEVTSTNDPTAHAEVVAIRNACEKLGSFQLDDCIVYTSCEPCPMCLGAIYWARPKKVFYGNTKKDAADIGFDDDFIYKELELQPADRKVPFVEHLRDEAIEAFKDWSKKTDKTEY